MDADEEHLRLLAVFHYVLGGIRLFYACLPLLYVLIGAIMIGAPLLSRDPDAAPIAVVGVFFVAMGAVVALLGLAFGGATIFAGMCLAQRRHYTFCLVMAALNCIAVPIGTVLGVLTIVVLVRPGVQGLFGRQGAGAPAPQPWWA
jgi:hypothetical protein